MDNIVYFDQTLDMAMLSSLTKEQFQILRFLVPRCVCEGSPNFLGSCHSSARWPVGRGSPNLNSSGLRAKLYGLSPILPQFAPKTRASLHNNSVTSAWRHHIKNIAHVNWPALTAGDSLPSLLTWWCHPEILSGSISLMKGREEHYE